MIGALTGKIITQGRNPLLIDVHGIGYTVAVPPRLLGAFPYQKEVTIYTYTQVREDVLELYGFETLDEYDTFCMLTTVSGIGPKTALLIMNHDVKEIVHAIRTADVNFFTDIPRLGSKNAQKIIIELKNKLGSLSELNLQADGGSETKELIDALLNMGFAKPEIQHIVQSIDMTQSLPEKLRQSLRLLGKKRS